MLDDWKQRTHLLLGDEGMQKLHQAHVLIVGLGGVGGFAAECIVRAGVGRLTIADGDRVEKTNLNRQLVALNTTEGLKKTEALKVRFLSINPELELQTVDEYLTAEDMQKQLQTSYDMVLDCIDTLSPKVELILSCLKHKIPVVSALGAGGKIDPLMIRISDISKSNNCRLARALRKRLHRAKVYSGFDVVYSPEEIDHLKVVEIEGGRNKKSVIGTISYLPPLVGGFCASIVIRRLLGLPVARS